MTISQRTLLSDFILANPLYANARIAVYEADMENGGAATTTLATLYAGATGSVEEGNPFHLDGDGKLLRPVYVDRPVICRVTGAATPSHDTGVVGMMQRYRAEWEAGATYQISDIIRDAAAGSDTGYLYICAQPHQSGTVFANDLASGLWVLYLTGGTGGGGGGSGIDVVGTASVSAGTSFANFLRMVGGNSGSAPTLSALGADTNVPLRLIPKGTSAVEALGPFTATGTSTFGSTSAARVLVQGGGTLSNGGRAVITTAGSDTNTHLYLGTKNANSVLATDRAFLQTRSSNLNDHVALRNTATAFYSHNNVNYGSVLAPRFQVTGSVSGTVTSTNQSAEIHLFSVASDDVDAMATSGLSTIRVLHTVGGSNFAGHRTGVSSMVRHAVASPNQTPFRFITGGSLSGITSAITGSSHGFGYDETDGYIFGALLRARAESGGHFTKSLEGLEFNVGNQQLDVPVHDMGAIQVVMETADVGGWMRQGVAYGIVNQSGWPSTSQGWGTGFAYVQANGRWAINRTYGQIMGGQWTGQYGAKPNCMDGIDFAQVDFSRAAFRGSNGNFIVDGSGNVGGANVGGVELRTRGEVSAYTSVVGAITVIDGSLCLTKPTVTLSAPPGSGTTATASVNTMAADYMRRLFDGAGYEVNDTVTLVGGTFTTAAVYTVTAVDGTGRPTRLRNTTPGSYTVLPAGPISTTTSGSGTGLTLDVWWRILTMTIDNAGTNYAPGLPPHATWTYTQDGGNRSPLREPKLLITLTPTRVPLRLNAGSINVTGIPTSSAGLSAGDVWNDGGTLKVA